MVQAKNVKVSALSLIRDNVTFHKWTVDKVTNDKFDELRQLSQLVTTLGIDDGHELLYHRDEVYPDFPNLFLECKRFDPHDRYILLPKRLDRAVGRAIGWFDGRCDMSGTSDRCRRVIDKISCDGTTITASDVRVLQQESKYSQSAHELVVDILSLIDINELLPSQCETLMLTNEHGWSLQDRELFVRPLEFYALNCRGVKFKLPTSNVLDTSSWFLAETCGMCNLLARIEAHGTSKVT